MKEKSLDNIVGARKNSRDREVESMDMWSGLHLWIWTKRTIRYIGKWANEYILSARVNI